MLALAAFADAQRGLHIVSAGADGTLGIWRAVQSVAAPLQLQLLSRMQPRGTPVFSLISSAGRLFAGTAGKDVLWATWADVVSGGEVPFARACPNHTGWVRALASDGQSLFTCGCNFVRAWDLSTLEPHGQARLFSGDVLALAAGEGGAIFSGGADGSLHRFGLSDRRAVALRQSNDATHCGRVEVR